ncbi:hypothetical protein LOD99_12870 [Oopsacas minuta]|uniref:Uncharacterized protein n=1 Tax=Oopsacas minuta TaxID=111878 RepID=A0AAV7JDG7_9METZ|nr:hypothetical protein LOD99_12870 [Oopsacas minuta]
MATAYTEPATKGSILDDITAEIIQVFERILSEVKSRRDELLAEVSKIRTELEAKNSSMNENLKELEEMRVYVEKLSVKQNLAMKKQEGSLADIDTEVGKLKNSLNENSNFEFHCNINQLITQVKQFGKIMNESHLSSIYSKKLRAIKVIEGCKGRQFGSSAKLSIDSDKELLYVFVDAVITKKGRFPVAIFNTKDFSFINEFGDSNYNHNCIATSTEFIYFGSYSSSYNRGISYNTLLQYRQTDYSLAKEIRINKEYSNIAVTSENEVIVLCHSKCDFFFNVYDRALNFKEEIKLNFQSKIGISRKVLPMQQRGDEFYILLNNQLLVYNRGGTHAGHLYDKEGESRILANTQSFYLDESGNIIVTNSRTNSIKFFSPAGILFHTIGEDEVGSDEVEGVNDIIVYKGKVIVSCNGVTPWQRPSCIRIY